MQQLADGTGAADATGAADNAAYGAGPEMLESLRFRDYLMFVGFQAHGLYWNREDEPSTDCFSRVVEYLYAGQPALS